MNPYMWVNTTGFPPDGREHFRQLRQFGNAHAVFEPGQQYGEVHFDEHNAVDFPVGTINHLAKYANEQTGVDEGLARVAIAGAGLYLLYKTLQGLSRNLQGDVTELADLERSLNSRRQVST